MWIIKEPDKYPVMQIFNYKFQIAAGFYINYRLIIIMLCIFRILEYIASPGIVIPLIVLMTLVIYYMVSLTNSLRESNNDLKIQLRKERTEERRKMFKIAEKRLENNDTPFARWKKILPNPTITRTNNDSIKSNQVKNGREKSKERKHSDDTAANLTESDQDLLPNDQTASSSITVHATVNDKKNGWRSSKAKELEDHAAIPRIRISSDEPSDALQHPENTKDDDS